MRTSRERFAVFVTFTLAVVCTAFDAPPQPILAQIRDSWNTLTRSNRQLATAAVDPKFAADSDGRWRVYIAADENLANIENKLRREMPQADFGEIALRQLPAAQGKQGLLYLPEPYVVPGGRFNEMYGWDSYFIRLGLLRDKLDPLAKDMADNFLYEVSHYGKILNANRTYYLGRSQPPFLTQMVLGVYRQTHDKQWLAASVPRIEAYYKYWTSGAHLTDTGLSRYWDSGEGPAPEVVSAERDAQGNTHYDAVRAYYRTHKVPDYDVSQYYDAAHDRLTPLFYKGDRSMRESGFDPSNRFGPFNVDIIHYNPVCLNTLLFLMEMDAAEIARILGRAMDADAWRRKAADRAAKINALLWDDRAGLYLDYDFVHKRRRDCPFLTAFYPLWAGIATPTQATAVEKTLQLFDQPGGLQTSTTRSGNQWDAPFGWAPLEFIAVEGLRRYGDTNDANRIAERFLRVIDEQYAKTGTIVEKYDVVTPGADVSSKLRFGYRSNEVGFGWTNAVYTALLDELPPANRGDLAH